MDKEKVLNMAKLARIKLEDEEAESLTAEFETILNYVGEVNNVDSLSSENIRKKEDYTFINVMREDNNPHESGLYTKKFLEQAPLKEGSYIKVKKIL